MDRKTELDSLFSKAYDAQESGNFERALRLYRQGAAKGDDDAQHAIGIAYDNGNGVKQDKRKALHWFKEA